MLVPGDWVRYSNKFLWSAAGCIRIKQTVMLVRSAGVPRYEYRRGRVVYMGRILLCGIFPNGKESPINDRNLSLVHKGKHLVNKPPELKIGDLVKPYKFDGHEFVTSAMAVLVGRILPITDKHPTESALEYKVGGWWWPASALVRQDKKKHEVSKVVRENYRAPWAR